MLDDYLTLTRDDVVAGYRWERLRLRERIAGLSDAELATESLCEGWRVRDVVAHLAGIVADVLAGDTTGAGRPAATERQVASRADVPLPELLGEWDDVGAQLESLMATMDAETWTSVLASGQTLAQGAERLLEDLWVHANDVGIALGDAPADGPGLAATLNAVLHEWRLRFAHFAPDLGAAIVTGHVHLEIGDQSDPALLAGDPVVLALLASDRLHLDEAPSVGRCAVDPRIPAEVIGIYLEPVPSSTMFSAPS